MESYESLPRHPSWKEKTLQKLWKRWMWVSNGWRTKRMLVEPYNWNKFNPSSSKSKINTDCNICDERFKNKFDVIIHKKDQHRESFPMCRNSKNGLCEFSKCCLRHDGTRGGGPSWWKLINITKPNQIIWKEAPSLPYFCPEYCTKPKKLKTRDQRGKISGSKEEDLLKNTL